MNEFLALHKNKSIEEALEILWRNRNKYVEVYHFNIYQGDPILCTEYKDSNNIADNYYINQNNECFANFNKIWNLSFNYKVINVNGYSWNVHFFEHNRIPPYIIFSYEQLDAHYVEDLVDSKKIALDENHENNNLINTKEDKVLEVKIENLFQFNAELHAWIQSFFKNLN